MNGIFIALIKLTAQKFAIAIVAVGALYYFLLYDDGARFDAQIKTLEEQIQAEEIKKSETIKLIKEQEKLKQLVNSLSDQYLTLQKRLPSEFTIIEINKILDRVSRSTGASIKTRTPGASIKTEVIEELPFDVTLEGKFSELASFIYDISSSERLLKIKSINIERATSAGRTKLLKLQCTISGFRFIGESESEAPGDAQSAQAPGAPSPAVGQ